MVRAILEGRKTQTRRIAKAEKFLKYVRPFVGAEAERRLCNHTWPGKRVGMMCQDCHREIVAHCPFGKPGDRLWVRETWRWVPTQGTWTIQDASTLEPGLLRYAADHPGGLKHWTPSIHMPRWASRILLEVVSVRVERLHSMKLEDYDAEGYLTKPTDVVEAVAAWEELWDVLHGKGSFDADPWVWVVEFKRVDA
jgi:hypothetical protein